MDISELEFSNIALLDSNFINQNFSQPTQPSGRMRNRNRRSEGYSNISEAVVQGAFGAGTAALGALGGALANKQPNVAKQAIKAKKADLKLTCGRKPIFGKDKKAKYLRCVNSFMKKFPTASTDNTTPDTSTPDTTPSPTLDNSLKTSSGGGDSGNGGGGDKQKFYQKPVFIVGAVLVGLGAAFLLYKMVGKKAPVVVAH